MSLIFKRLCAHVRAENWLLAIAIIPIVHPIIDFFMIFNSSPQNRFHSNFTPLRVWPLAIFGLFWPENRKNGPLSYVGSILARSSVSSP